MSKSEINQLKTNLEVSCENDIQIMQVNECSKSTNSAIIKNVKLTGADGIRALACLSVILHHLSQKLAMQAQSKGIQEAQAFFLVGNAGVSIFFVLSGFLLSYPFWKQYFNDGKYPSIKQYIIRRAARIIPGYYIALIVSLVAITALKLPIEHLGIRLLAGFTFTAGFHYITFFPVEMNNALWSISFEVFSYMLMPVFMFVLFKYLGEKRSAIKSLLYWLAVMAFITYINKLVHNYLTPNDINKGWQYGNIGGAKYWMPNYNPIGFFGHFSIGIIAAGITCTIAKYSLRLHTFKKFGIFDLISVLALTGAYFLLWKLRHGAEFSFSLQKQPYYFPSFAILIGISLATAAHSRIVGLVLDNPFFRFTSKVSFGLYVWHYFIIALVSTTVVKQYQYMGISDLKKWAIISFLIIAVSYVIASISYYFIEKPILDWAHRKSKSAGN